MNSDRYLKITRWADSRYRINGRLIISKGGIPAPYQVIEKMAFDKYITGKN